VEDIGGYFVVCQHLQFQRNRAVKISRNNLYLLFHVLYRRFNSYYNVWLWSYVVCNLLAATLNGQNTEQLVLSYYGNSLHCALRSRTSELEYMRRLTEQIFPFVLPPRSLQCRSVLSCLVTSPCSQMSCKSA